MSIGRRLEYHLKLRVLVKSVRIFAVAAIGGTPAGLRIHDAIRIRPEDAQKRFGMHRTGADFNIVGLLQNAPALNPVFLELEQDFLKREAFRFGRNGATGGLFR